MQNNPFTEIGAIGLAALLIIGGVILVYAGKITFTDVSLMLTFALALFGGNLALKAPSPAQQAQLQQITQQALSAVAAQAQQQPVVPMQPAPVATSSIDPHFFVPATPPVQP